MKSIETHSVKISLSRGRAVSEAKSTRFEIGGIRYYRTGDDNDAWYPSVTAILGKTSSAASKKALLTWAANNPGAREKAAERGTAVHAAAESYVRGLPIQIQDDYRPFWDGLSTHLDRYDHFIWSEKPLNPQWRYCTGEDGISRVWSHKHGFTGCPDIIGIRNDVVILSDFKTSVNPYCRWYPKEDDRTNFTGWMKFKKCALQLAAYAMASEETLGIQVNACQILVSTPTENQMFFIRGDELEMYKVSWRQRVRQFYELVSSEWAAGDQSLPLPEHLTPAEPANDLVPA
jgi:hypothetical protein